MLLQKSRDSMDPEVERSARFRRIECVRDYRAVHEEIPATLLLDPRVIEDPYPFYRQLHVKAPVWQVPGTDGVPRELVHDGGGCHRPG